MCRMKCEGATGATASLPIKQPWYIFKEDSVPADLSLKKLRVGVKWWNKCKDIKTDFLLLR